jgi:hypothetical protein
MIVASGATTGRTMEFTKPSVARSWWMPRWLQRQREEQALERWAAELGWVWYDAADIAQLTRHSMTPARLTVTHVPEVHSVDEGPPVTLLVRMLPGQVADDFHAQEERLASAMDVPAVRIEPYEPGWIKVILLENES